MSREFNRPRQGGAEKGRAAPAVQARAPAKRSWQARPGLCGWMRTARRGAGPGAARRLPKKPGMSAVAPEKPAKKVRQGGGRMAGAAAGCTS